MSDVITDEGEWICLDIGRHVWLKEIIINFDSNLSEEICVTMSEKAMKRQSLEAPPRIVKNYNLELYKG